MSSLIGSGWSSPAAAAAAAAVDSSDHRKRVGGPLVLVLVLVRGLGLDWVEAEAAR